MAKGALCGQAYPSLRAGPPNPGPRSAATRAEMKTGLARIRGVSIVVPTCKPAKLRRAVGTDFCGKLQPARNRSSFCGPPECQWQALPECTSMRNICLRIYCRPEQRFTCVCMFEKLMRGRQGNRNDQKTLLHTRRPLKTSHHASLQVYA